MDKISLEFIPVNKLLLDLLLNVGIKWRGQVDVQEYVQDAEVKQERDM